ncbi:MAG TPA: DUF2269 family protein [Gaiellaceae bacterium]
MSKYDWLLFLHITFAFLFAAGAVIAGVLQFSTMRRNRPSEVALLFRLTRVAEILVGVGSVGALLFGVWLTHYLGYGFGDGWIVGALVLWVVSGALAGMGGRTYRKARELAEELARSGDEPSDRLRALVRNPVALVLSYLGTAALVAILVLMVWKPGNG